MSHKSGSLSAVRASALASATATKRIGCQTLNVHDAIVQGAATVAEVSASTPVLASLNIGTVADTTTALAGGFVPTSDRPNATVQGMADSLLDGVLPDGTPVTSIVADTAASCVIRCKTERYDKGQTGQVWRSFYAPSGAGVLHFPLAICDAATRGPVVLTPVSDNHGGLCTYASPGYKGHPYWKETLVGHAAIEGKQPITVTALSGGLSLRLSVVLHTIVRQGGKTTAQVVAAANTLPSGAPVHTPAGIAAKADEVLPEALQPSTV